MEQIFMTARLVQFKYADLTPKRNVDRSHFEILQRLSEKKLFPDIYIELLNSLQTVEDRSELSKKFLKIYLYASTKIKDPRKLYDWLLKGSLPQKISQDADTMTLLTQNIKKINKLKKLQDKEIDKIGKTRDRMSEKSTKKLEDNLNTGQDKLKSLESQFSYQKEQIENIILEIESSLASGRKL